MEPKNCACATNSKISKGATIKVENERVANVERGVWGYRGKRDKVTMNGAAGAKAKL